MLSDADYDLAVKQIAHSALEKRLDGEALRKYVEEEASTFLDGEAVCNAKMADDIRDYLAWLIDRPRTKPPRTRDDAAATAPVGLLLASGLAVLAVAGALALPHHRIVLRSGRP